MELSVPPALEFPPEYLGAFPVLNALCDGLYREERVLSVEAVIRERDAVGERLPGKSHGDTRSSRDLGAMELVAHVSARVFIHIR